MQSKLKKRFLGWEAPFDAEEFPFAFLEAFGNKATTLKKLRSEQSSSN